MKKVLTAAFLSVAALTACEQASVPEMTRYEGQALQLSAKMTPGLIDAEFKLYVDNELVINDRTQPFGGSSQTFEGTWKGKQVVARATSVQKFMTSYIMVDVFIDGTLVDTLTV
jgi:hypothetical protein